MLVLSRKRDEKIVIDGKITITIVDVRGDKVRIGIDAPKDVVVHRYEVFEAIQKKSPNVQLELETEEQRDERLAAG